MAEISDGLLYLNDSFLKECGLESLSTEERQSLLEACYDELELRVGASLSKGMTDKQLDEFANLIDGDHTVAVSWLAANQPDYLSNPKYLRLRELVGEEASEQQLVREYAPTAWLGINRADYREVVASEVQGLRDELTKYRDIILS